MDTFVNTKQEDFLEEDSELRGQKYVCLSFISPEDVIKQKNVFFVHKFILSISADVSLLLTNLENHFPEDSNVKTLVDNLRGRYDYLSNEDSSIYEEYNQFVSKNSDKLDEEYLEKNKFQTSVRGIKVRGSYETLVEAEKRAKDIQKFDKNFNVYVAQVGCWCPWNPSPENLDSEYAETQLNTLMKKYSENQKAKDEVFQNRKGVLMDSFPKVSIVEENSST